MLNLFNAQTVNNHLTMHRAPPNTIVLSEKICVPTGPRLRCLNHWLHEKKKKKLYRTTRQDLIRGRSNSKSPHPLPPHPSLFSFCLTGRLWIKSFGLITLCQRGALLGTTGTVGVRKSQLAMRLYEKKRDRLRKGASVDKNDQSRAKECCVKDRVCFVWTME